VRYARKHECTTEVLFSAAGKVSFQVCGSAARRLFRNEPGKHVVQRYPATECRGRRHTSVVAVAVLDVRAETHSNALKDSELEITTKRGSGPGGQHRNKTESCVMIRHVPTGLTATVDGRDQHSNKKKARQVLTARVMEHKNNSISSRWASDKREQFDGSGRGNKVRTYNFIENRVTDHRTGAKSTQIQRVMKGDFDLLWTT